MEHKDDIRFNDIRKMCQWRNPCGDCTHIDNGLSDEREPPCAFDYCPLVEIDIEEGDDADYSEGEQPVRLIDQKQPPKGRD